MNSVPQPAYLIINADDYGYFDCVSRGILRAFEQGGVTATGIFANSAHFDEHVDWLADYPDLDLGVHLNLTAREPLSVELRDKLAHTHGAFPGKYGLVTAVLLGTISRSEVTAEWREQIERCLATGLQIRFLNSHEHIHMLPPLFSVLQALAREYAIPHIRFSTPEVLRNWAPGALIRDAAMRLLAAYNRPSVDSPVTAFLGMGVSGQLDGAYLQGRLAKLKPGQVYELMCHPGQCAGDEVHDPRLRSYHDWNGELASLTDPGFRETLRRHGVRLIGYRHLQIQDGQLAVASATH